MSSRGIKFEDESLTQQHHAVGATPREVVNRLVSGAQVNTNQKQPMYIDNYNNLDYQDSLNLVIAVKDKFMHLPAQVRERFKHKPEEFVQFMENDENKEEAIKLGLIPDDYEEPLFKADSDKTIPAPQEEEKPAQEAETGSSE